MHPTKSYLHPQNQQYQTTKSSYWLPTDIVFKPLSITQSRGTSTLSKASSTIICQKIALALVSQQKQPSNLSHSSPSKIKHNTTTEIDSIWNLIVQLHQHTDTPTVNSWPVAWHWCWDSLKKRMSRKQSSWLFVCQYMTEEQVASKSQRRAHV